MKIIINSIKTIFLVILTMFVLSCEKEGDSFDVSKETIFPTIEHESEVVVEIGGAYTPSAVAMEGDKILEYNVSSNFDNTTPGAYDVIYSAKNTEGYSKSSSQLVFVYDPAIVPTDVTGNIWDAGNHTRTGVITLVEGTTNIFHCTDFGFAGQFPLYFQMNGDVPTVINQTFALSATGADLTYDPVARTFFIVIHDYEYTYTFEYE